MNLYAIAVPLTIRLDVREFFANVVESTLRLLNQVNDLLLDKGLLVKIPIVPIRDKIEYARKPSFLNGYLGDVRTLHALEVAHLWDCTEICTVGKALLLGFSQVSKTDRVRKFFIESKEMTVNQLETCADTLHKEDLPSPHLLDDMVATSTFSPFSDKLMLFHIIEAFVIRMRSYGNSLAANGRHDIGLMYSKLLAELAVLANQGSKILLENGWMELMPHAADREDLSSK